MSVGSWLKFKEFILDFNITTRLLTVFLRKGPLMRVILYVSQRGSSEGFHSLTGFKRD